MKSIFLLVISLTCLAEAGFIRQHNLWFTSLKSQVISGNNYAQQAWNWCDLKCLYLQHYYQGLDFVYINFSQNGAPNFAACYIRRATSVGFISYALWDTVAQNNWYNTYCGHDTIDYYALSQGSHAIYTVVSVQGVGIGNYPIY